MAELVRLQPPGRKHQPTHAKGKTMTNRRFYIQSGSGAEGLHLHIEDDISGVTLADIDLTPEQTWALLRGGTMHVDGEQTDHLDRVGKQMVNESLEVPGSLLLDVEYSDRVKVGEQWARKTAPGWDSYEARRTNTGGVRVVVRKWIGDRTNEDASNAAAGLYGSVEG